MESTRRHGTAAYMLIIRITLHMCTTLYSSWRFSIFIASFDPYNHIEGQKEKERQTEEREKFIIVLCSSLCWKEMQGYPGVFGEALEDFWTLKLKYVWFLHVCLCVFFCREDPIASFGCHRVPWLPKRTSDLIQLFISYTWRNWGSVRGRGMTYAHESGRVGPGTLCPVSKAKFPSISQTQPSLDSVS